MTEEHEVKAHAIIHSASLATAGIGGGLAQVPGADNALIVPLQIAMIISLAAVFEIKLTKAAATATLASSTATIAGRGLSQILVGWIPVIGNIINASTAFGITETIGWLVANDFASQNKKN